LRIAWAGSARHRLAAASSRLDATQRQLDALSPLRVLERGYAIVRDSDGNVVRDPLMVAAGATVAIEVAGGHLGATVTDRQSR
jgi:exodeoxyribonuclease VII large subunit